MDRITIVQEIIKKIRAKTYLEIGVNTGTCFLNINGPKKKIGVDPKFLFPKNKETIKLLRKRNNKSNEYFEMTSDTFFEKPPKILLNKGLDVVFIDGLHTHEQSLKDVLNSLKYLKDYGVIIMHDCNPPTLEAALPAKSINHTRKLPGFTLSWCGDVWKTISYLRSTHDDLNIFVVNCDFGVGIITKRKPKTHFNYSPDDIKKLTYEELEKDRINILNLKNLNYYYNYIKTLYSPELNPITRFWRLKRKRILRNKYVKLFYKFFLKFISFLRKSKLFFHEDRNF